MSEKEKLLAGLSAQFLNLEFTHKNILDRIVQIAKTACHTPVSRITWIGTDQQHVLSSAGKLDVEHDANQELLCRKTLLSGALLEVKDIHNAIEGDEINFLHAEPMIRFYAGMPLTFEGFNLGTISVVDHIPRQLSDSQKDILQLLASQVIQLFELERDLRPPIQQFSIPSLFPDIYQSYFESSSALRLILGKNAEILAFNHSMASFVLKAYAIQLSKDTDVRKIIHTSNQKKFSAAIKAALAGKTVDYRIQLGYHQGDICWQLHYEPVYRADSDLIAVSLMATNITSGVKEDQLLREENQSLKELAAMLTHDLRIPANAMHHLIDIFMSDGYTPSGAEPYILLQTARELSDKLEKLTVFLRPKSP